MMENAQKFFLAANSCQGFISKFDSDFKGGTGFAYIIKGGPGTGKSSFLKYIAARSYGMGAKVILCPCSSDPDSLDGVILEDINTVILDGTAPHVVEPVYPGVSEEIINLGEFWNGEALKENAEQIIRKTNETSAIHQTASGYLRAAGEFLSDNLKLSKAALKHKKSEYFAESICKKYIKSGKGFGKEKVRFITGVTPKGVVTYHKSLESFYKNSVIIEDRYGAAANEICSYIRKYALVNGYDVMTVKNAFLPDEITDHIIIPSLSLCILREHTFCHFEGDNRRIHSRRFYDIAVFNRNKNRLNFNRKIFVRLIETAAEELQTAKSSHDELEKYYVNAMDFNAAAKFAEIFFEEKIKPKLKNK